MAKEGSVAPKERINIVYKPATGDAQENIELPLKLMIIGDFTGKEDKRNLEDREPISVDKDNFNDVLNAQGLSLKIVVPNKLVDDDPENMLNVDLKFDKISDFNPDSLVSQVPELSKLIELRGALKALKGPLSNVPDFRRKIQEMISDENARSLILKELGLDEE